MPRESGTASEGRCVRRVATALLWLTCIASAPSARALSIYLDPAQAVLTAGDSTTTTVRVMGVGDGPSDAVGAFDVTLSWDPAVITLESVTFTDALGGASHALGSTTEGAGWVRLSAVSLLSTAALAAGQGDDLAIAVLSVRGLAPGITTLAPDGDALFGDARGVKLPITGTAVASIQVVPEPASLVSLGGGLAAYAALRRRRLR
jgi:hypothetical protein